MARENMVSPGWTTYCTHKAGGPQGCGVGGAGGKKIIKPTRSISCCKQLARMMAASDVPERTASFMIFSPDCTVVGSQPPGTAPHSSGSGEDRVGIDVGKGVFVGVAVTSGIAGSGVVLGEIMVTSAIIATGEGDGGCGEGSICASNNASSTVPTTPKVMITFHCQRPVSCVSRSIYVFMITAVPIRLPRI